MKHPGIARAKDGASKRRALEAMMPADLRFIKRWPRIPTWDEVVLIAQCRAPILARHGLENRFPDAPTVRARFGELLLRDQYLDGLINDHYI